MVIDVKYYKVNGQSLKYVVGQFLDLNKICEAWAIENSHLCHILHFKMLYFMFEKKIMSNLLVCVTNSLSNKWYLRTLCIGTAKRSLSLKRPSLAAVSQASTTSLIHSSLVQRLSRRCWAEKKWGKSITYKLFVKN